MAWDDGNWVRLGVGLLVLEFVVLHSGVFVSAMIATQEELSKKLQYAAGLTLFYSLLVLGFALLKGHLVADWFMGLRGVRGIWRWVVVVWLLIPGGLISLAFVWSYQG